MQDRNDSDRRLARHLGIVIVLKLLALALLWQFFVRDQRVTVDSRRAAEIVAPAPTPSPRSPTEPRHDQ